jgi:Fic family protein
MYVERPPETALRYALLAYQRGAPVAPGYLHWDKLRHITPPDGITHETWWALTKFRRTTQPFPLLALDGTPCRYGTPDDVQRLLHFVDKQCAGQVAMEEVVTDDDQARQHYLVSGLMEEAIRSSQLEGASTTRQVAKDLLRTGREPVDRSEQMILNNYRALTFMREDAGDRLTPETVLELQRILTEGTLDEPDAAGRLQRPDETRVAVYDSRDRILHMPPPAEELPARLQALCDFANEPIDGARFIHPVVRAILLHFWLAYDHPFVDGNGRTARALFYWYLRTRGYWLVEYLSISRILREAPAQYTRAFLYAETDDNDTTYFLLHQLEVVERAVHELYAYLRRKMGEVRAVESLIADDERFNHRQLALLSDALRHPERRYTFAGHAREHRVTHETARTDLSQLAQRELLLRTRHGRGYRFSAPADIELRLRNLGTGA